MNLITRYIPKPRKADDPVKRFRLRLAQVLGVVFLLLISPVSAQVPPAQTIDALTQSDEISDVESVLNPGETLQPLQLDNPIGVIQSAAESVPGFEGGISSTLNILILLTVLSLAPAILILCTSFTRIIVVLALLRQAIGTQSLPPSQVLMGLSMFMTFLIMSPTFDRINQTALIPLSEGSIDQVQAWTLAKQPLRDFMFDQLERTGNWSDLYMVMEYRGMDITRPDLLQRSDVDMLSLIPSYIISELKTAFLIGFRIYLPFLIIDMVIASVLISMGMMMLPPPLISLPFKLLLFVLVDGWRLVVGNLLESFTPLTPPAVAQLGSLFGVG